MKTSVREQRIISILESRGEMSVSDLSQLLGVSVSTLRKQLADMQDKKLVIRTYGGVMSVNPFPDETFDSKMHKSVSEKRRIAARARLLIKDGCSVSLGSGTTIYDLSNLLDDLRRCVIYTNSMQAADYLARCAGLEVHICGGIIRSSTGTVIGTEACDSFRSVNVDFAFISCDAIDDDGNVYSDNLAVATVESAVISNAKRKYILCDSSKLGKKIHSQNNLAQDLRRAYNRAGRQRHSGQAVVYMQYYICMTHVDTARGDARTVFLFFYCGT